MLFAEVMVFRLRVAIQLIEYLVSFYAEQSHNFGCESNGVLEIITSVLHTETFGDEHTRRSDVPRIYNNFSASNLGQ